MKFKIAGLENHFRKIHRTLELNEETEGVALVYLFDLNSDLTIIIN
ncbi:MULTISPECIES: hypothetical protein [Pedobacter]|nr:MULTISPECIES: hypothetical protein [Pedobacter]